MNPFDTFHRPWLVLIQGAHEHFVETQGVGSIAVHDVVWIDDISK